MKKNYLFLLAIAMMLFSACSSDEWYEEPEVTNETMEEKGDERRTKNADTKHRYLGFGYDVTGDYLDKTSVRQPIIDVEKFIAEYGYTSVYYNPETGTDEEFYYGYNSADYIKEIKKESGYDLKASYNVQEDGTPENEKINGEFSGNFSKNKEYNEKYTYSSKYSFGQVDIKHHKMAIKFNERSIEKLRKHLTPTFISHLNEYSPDMLIEEYGTHVLCDIDMGGVVRMTYQSAISDEFNSTSKTNIVKAGLNIKIMGIGLSAHKNKKETIDESLSTKNQTNHTIIKSKGGVGALSNIDLENGNAKTNIENWYNSITYMNAGLININWEKTYAIYEFITDPVKKQQVKEAAERYIKGKKIGILEIIPMYRLWDNRSGYNDSFYTTKFNEYFNYPIHPNVHRNGVECYLLKNKLPASVPVHRFYDKGGRNHIDIFGDGEFSAYNSWCEYQGIQGYAYINEQPGTVVVHALFDTKGKNCILVTDPSILDSYKAWCAYNGTRSWVYPAHK